MGSGARKRHQRTGASHQCFEDAKDDQSEEVKINLVQVRKMAAALGLNQDPETYEFRSNDIISTLEGLHKQFIGKQNEHDKTEFDANAAWESRDLDNKNEKKFKEADKAEKEKISAYKDELKGKAQADRDAVAEEKRRNDAYLVDVKNECQDKAQLWDQRSQMRAGEITAVSEALALLKAKVNAQFGANKKLVGLQVQKAGPKSPTLSFLQISTGDRLRGANKVDSKGSKAITQKAAVLLSNAGRSLGSKTLALAAVRMLASDDHFVKVRSIINDLISRLESDARSEQTQKDLCDTGMSQGVRNRDSAQAALESTSATITKSEAAQATAAAAVAELSEQIAQMQKAIIEMTDLRMAEKAENQKTIATAKVGEQGIIDAIEIIRPFYEMAENSLVQLTTFSPLPSAAAKDNKEYRDTAPEIFQGKYHGDQKASKGILGLMDVIISDFERTINKVGGDESAAVINYDIDKKAMDGLVTQMSIEKTRQEGEVTRLGKVILGLEGNLKSEKTSKQTALDALSALESSCVDGEETYNERVAARNKEIEALQQAQNILEDWKGF